MSVVAYRINVPCEKMALVPFPHKFYSGVSILEAHVEGGRRAGRNRRRLQGGGRRRGLQVHFRLATGHATLATVACVACPVGSIVDFVS